MSDTGRPEAGTRRWIIVLVAAVAAAAVGAALSLAGLFDGSAGGRAGPGSDAASASPSPSGVSPSALPGPKSTATPAGYRLAQDPVGFTAAVPEGWQRRVGSNGTLVDFRASGAKDA